ncbi:hypothetical protein [Nonomuraea guangzhouensis]|uniref:Glyoxalase n=1 Tax=Nonomuraea guangzhouensis TaxID=1291555 RepID=A0ABW4GQD5_9ACTN|nr:hypothetical protein [Nonomuraea guangzhouensis]
MTSIASLTLEVADTEAAGRFYTAFGLGAHVRLRASEGPATGFRGFVLSLTVSQPATVNAFIGAALDAGPASQQFDEMVLLLGATEPSPVKLALYGRRALAKDVGVPMDGTGSHRITLGSDAGSFIDPDGFAWEAAA